MRGDFAFSVNGGREDANGYLLDGVYNMDPKLGTSGVRPPSTPSTSSASRPPPTTRPSVGTPPARSTSSRKSGANRFSGSAYEFFRNGALDSRNAFAPRDEPAPDYNRHQFGGSLGGPLAADRLFFFADYESTRLREGITRVTNVPTLAERQGDFSQSLFAPPRRSLLGAAVPGQSHSRRSF